MKQIPAYAHPLFVSAIALMALAGCSPSSTTNAANEAANVPNAMEMNMADAGTTSKTAALVNSKGDTIGEVTLTREDAGTKLTLTGRDLPAGVHGYHIHTTGKCDGPAFTTAGGHWNPTTHEHGHNNPKGAHAGDLPNLTVAANGTVSFETMLDGVSLTGGASPLLDADGAAVLIHADPDDEKTDPSGNSGARIACAAFAGN